MSIYLILDLLWLARISGKGWQPSTLSSRPHACNLAVMVVVEQKSVNGVEWVLRDNRT